MQSQFIFGEQFSNNGVQDKSLAFKKEVTMKVDTNKQKLEEETLYLCIESWKS